MLKKGGVFAINDNMKPRAYGDMEAFAQELRDMGFADVRLIDNGHGGLRLPPAGGHDDAWATPGCWWDGSKTEVCHELYICERLMWVAIAPAAFRYLARQELGWDISALKQLSKQIYRQMVSVPRILAP